MKSMVSSVSLRGGKETQEYSSSSLFSLATMIQRSVYLKAIVRFPLSQLLLIMRVWSGRQIEQAHLLLH